MKDKGNMVRIQVCVYLFSAWNANVTISFHFYHKICDTKITPVSIGANLSMYRWDETCSISLNIK